MVRPCDRLGDDATDRGRPPPADVRWVTPELAIGNIEHAMNAARLRDRGITAVLGLNRFPSLRHVTGLEWRRVELIDGYGNTPDEVMRAVYTLEELLQHHHVLVHCDAGLSRSPFVSACYLARRLGCGFDDAFAIVRSRVPGAHADEGLLALRPLLDLAFPT